MGRGSQHHLRWGPPQTPIDAGPPSVGRASAGRASRNRTERQSGRPHSCGTEPHAMRPGQGTPAGLKCKAGDPNLPVQRPLMPRATAERSGPQSGRSSRMRLRDAGDTGARSQPPHLWSAVPRYRFLFSAGLGNPPGPAMKEVGATDWRAGLKEKAATSRRTPRPCQTLPVCTARGTPGSTPPVRRGVAGGCRGRRCYQPTSSPSRAP